MTFLLDASAVLATTLGEPGADAAHDAMVDGQISIMNRCEVLTKLADGGLEVSAAERMIDAFELAVHPFTRRRRWKLRSFAHSRISRVSPSVIGPAWPMPGVAASPSSGLKDVGPTSISVSISA